MKHNFYGQMRGFSNFMEFVNEEHYLTAPADWFVVITDIEGSTQAIAEGRYKTVNMAGAASIAAIINAMGTREIPFVFGGDGATALIPEESVPRVSAALAKSREVCELEHGLKLRIGIVPHRDLLTQGVSLRIAKYQLTKKNALAFFKGSALGLAEKLVKSGQYLLGSQTGELGFDPHEGLSCRWAPLLNTRGLILSVLIKFTDSVPDETIRSVLKQMNQIVDLGSKETNPVKYESLGAEKVSKAIALESSFLRGSFFSRSIKPRIAMTLVILLNSLYEKALKAYKSSMAPHSDYRKFDEMLRMVVDCSLSMRDELQALLEDLRKKGFIHYGLHESKQALMTCFVQDLEENHVHFIDGGDGGYALAARQLKQQMKDL